jgi:hypothetical protein
LSECRLSRGDQTRILELMDAVRFSRAIFLRRR